MTKSGKNIRNIREQLKIKKEVITKIYLTPPLGQDITQGQFLSEV